MAQDFDEFVDSDYQTTRKGAGAAGATAGAADTSRAPTREEVDARVSEMQHQLGELRRAQHDLERERAALEETRRRQSEFTTGRHEMVQHLTRGVTLLEEAELSARRDAEQMAKTLAEFRDAILKLQGIHEESWARDNLNVELTRASTLVENARMEWNSARLKFPILSGETAPPGAPLPPGVSPIQDALTQRSYAEWCKLGLALTWPVAAAALLILLVLLLR
jgi:DNA repair exonuclease SbcCD ATPase subunit